MNVPPEPELKARLRAKFDDADDIHTAIITDATASAVYVNVHARRSHPDVPGAVVAKERYVVLKDDDSDVLLSDPVNRRVTDPEAFAEKQRLAWGRFQNVEKYGYDGDILVVRLEGAEE